MKKLFLMRHAKSSWYKFHIKDYERPLNDKGIESSIFIGKYLQKKKNIIDNVITSGAKRAVDTAKNVLLSLELEKDIIINDSIYESSSNGLRTILNSIDDGDNTIILIGHNPSITLLAYELVGFDRNIPTAGILEIDADVKSWKKIRNVNSKLVSFEYPKKNN